MDASEGIGGDWRKERRDFGGRGYCIMWLRCRLHGYIKSSQAWCFHCVEIYIKNCGLCVEVVMSRPAVCPSL